MRGPGEKRAHLPPGMARGEVKRRVSYVINAGQPGSFGRAGRVLATDRVLGTGRGSEKRLIREARCNSAASLT